LYSCLRITSASGNIGKRLIPLLIAHPSSPTIVLPTNNASRLISTLPSNADQSRIHVVEGSVQDPGFVEQTLKTYKVTAVFLCLTGDDELFTTFNFLDSIKRSGCVKHLVYLSACGDYSLEAIQRGVLKDVSAAHVAVKFLIEAKLRHGLPERSEKGGFSWTIIGPSLFYSNDLQSKRHLLEDGIFIHPLGSKGVSRVDAGDIAIGVTKALVDDGESWHGKKVMIGSLETYTSQDVANLWSNALGKEVKPILSDNEGFNRSEKDFTAHAGAAWGRDLRLMLEGFEAQRFYMTKEDYDEQVKLLGKEPESYSKFVEETAKEWKVEKITHE
jgi:uncharacterized protein YbjT (DUF2867 family)